jgi:hypothetical protein
MCNHHNKEFEMKDEWLVEADVVDFVPIEPSYSPDSANAREQDFLEIPIDDIAPMEERAVKGVSFDNEQDSGRERVVRILNWFRECQDIEPIGEFRLKENEKYKYKLVRGSHRFHCSIALGFSKISAILSIDINDPNL